MQIIKKVSEIVNKKPHADFLYTEYNDRFLLESTSQDSDIKDKLSFYWRIISDSIKVFNQGKEKAYFKIPFSTLTNTIALKLVVNDGKEKDSTIKYISIPKLNKTRLLGLGDKLQEEISNEVEQNWYFDQKNTGTYAESNCGPTSATMAIKWVKPNFNKTPETARIAYKPNGGWWLTSDIVCYLNDNDISNYIISIHQIDTLKTVISHGNIAILCIDMFYIRSETIEDWHIDKYISATKKGCGHFIIVKGYKIVDDKIYYEVYDPNSWGHTYDNQNPKGKDRYYRSEDLSAAAIYWWNYAIVVSKSNLKSAHLGIDPQTISHNWGK